MNLLIMSGKFLRGNPVGTYTNAGIIAFRQTASVLLSLTEPEHQSEPHSPPKSQG